MAVRFAIVVSCVAAAAGCDGLPVAPTNHVVDASDTTREAVVAGVDRALTARLEQVGIASNTVELEILIWEIRMAEGRDAPSDLVLLWCTYVDGGARGWALGQLFRHRAGTNVDWQWYVVADPAWRELRSFSARPTNADVDDFLVYWDFETDGHNGMLVAAELDPVRWRSRLEADPPYVYPEDTPDPDPG